MTHNYPEAEVCHNMCDVDNYYHTNSNYHYTQLYSSDSHNQGSHLLVNEEGYWDSACSSDSPNPNGSSPLNCHSYTSNSPYSYNRTFDYEKSSYLIDDGYHTGPSVPGAVGPVRVVKRRTTANKKERRRTQSINSAYLSLREHIPNVPNDTKLSKIKTLRLAKTYISYLVGVLDGEQDPQVGFRPELVPSSRKINAERKALMKSEMQNYQQKSTEPKKSKARTGWPQTVWAMEVRTTMK